MAMATPFFSIFVLWFAPLIPLSVPPLPEDPALAGVASADSLVFLELRGMAKPRPKAENAVEALLAEPEVTRFSSAIARGLRSALSKMLMRENPVLAQELPRLLRMLATRPACAFVDELSIERGGPPRIAGGIVVHAGEDARDAARALRTLVQLALDGNEGESRTVAEATIHALPGPPSGPPIEIAWGRRESYLFVGVGDDIAATIVRRLAGEVDGARPQAITSSLSRTTVARPSLLLSVDVAGLIKKLPPPVANEARPVLEALGLTALQTISQISGLDGQSFAVETHIQTEGELRGILSLFEAPPLEKSDVAKLPGDSTIALAGRLDLDEIYQEILDSIARIDIRARESAARNIVQVESELGLQLSEDIFQALGTRWRLYSSPSEGGLLVTGLTLGVDVRDRERLEQSIDRFTDILAAELTRGNDRGRLSLKRSFQHEETAIGVLDLTVPRYDAVPFLPSWCFVDGELLVSLYPQTLKAHLAEGGPGAEDGASGLLDRPEMAALWSEKRKLLGFSRFDTREFFRLVYPFLPPLFGYLSSELAEGGIRVPAELLPSAAAILPHLDPATSGLYRTEDGILMLQRGPQISGAAALAPVASWFLAHRSVGARARPPRPSVRPRDEAKPPRPREQPRDNAPDAPREKPAEAQPKEPQKR